MQRKVQMKLHRWSLRDRNVNEEQSVGVWSVSPEHRLSSASSLSRWDGEEKQRDISVAADGAQTHFISLSKNQRMLVRASVLNCSACVFIGNKCLCFVWVKVKGSYSVGINNRERFETADRRSNITERTRSDQHFKNVFLLSARPLKTRVCRAARNLEKQICWCDSNIQSDWICLTLSSWLSPLSYLSVSPFCLSQPHPPAPLTLVLPRLSCSLQVKELLSSGISRAAAASSKHLGVRGALAASSTFQTKTAVMCWPGFYVTWQQVRESAEPKHHRFNPRSGQCVYTLADCTSVHRHSC